MSKSPICFGSTEFSLPKENTNEECVWLQNYLEQIQDTFHEELARVQHESIIEEEEAFELPTTDVFTRKEREDEDYLDGKSLYPGAAITVGLSAFLIMTFALRHMLSGEALSDMLTLISAHCLSPNLCIKSIFQLKKHFQNLKALMHFHRYCSHCFLQIENDLTVCPNFLCARDLTCAGNTAFFI